MRELDFTDHYIDFQRKVSLWGAFRRQLEMKDRNAPSDRYPDNADI